VLVIILIALWSAVVISFMSAAAALLPTF